MKTLALVNNKGGVRKTTPAVSLATGLVAEGRKKWKTLKGEITL